MEKFAIVHLLLRSIHSHQLVLYLYAEIFLYSRSRNKDHANGN